MTGPAAEEEEREGGDMDGETPRGVKGEVIRVGGACPPQRKTRIYLDLPWNVRTCCCRKSMETSLTTTMGRTWMGVSLTTPYGSFFGAGLLPSHLAGMPRPQEEWGAASRPYWPWNGKG